MRSREQLVCDETLRVKIGAMIDVPPGRLLRGHVGGSADRHATAAKLALGRATGEEAEQTYCAYLSSATTSLEHDLKVHAVQARSRSREQNNRDVYESQNAA
jgi:hypothetical protein